jgi:hypothetical protein
MLYYTGLNSNAIKLKIKQINYAIGVLSFKWYNSEENWWWFDRLGGLLVVKQDDLKCNVFLCRAI